MTTKPNAILLLGPTGAGKTPLGETAQMLGLDGKPCRHFDFGSHLRSMRQHPPDHVSAEARKIIHEVLEQSRLLEPHEDFVACEILEQWLQNLPAEAIIILNGLPRTIAQATKLEKLLHVRLVVQLTADDDTILARIRQNSGGDRTHREDDDTAAVTKRLAAYRERTMPLVKHYQLQGVPIQACPIDCNTSPEQLWQTIPAQPEIVTTDQTKPTFFTPSEAARILQSGGVVAVPTETVYGLAADAGNISAVERIFSIKQRPANDPLIVHIYETSQIDKLTQDWSETAEILARQFWPGPLTIVVPKHPDVPDIVTAQLPTVAIRMPAHPVMREILRLCSCPLAAPSANRFGAVSPTTAQHVTDSLGCGPDGIVDGGPCNIGLESTIVMPAEDKIWLLRPGVITESELAAATQRPVMRYQPNSQQDIPAPGTMPKHYAPKTPIAFIGTPQATELSHGRIAHLAFGPQQVQQHTYHTEINLSTSGDLAEAAQHLYEALRSLDQLGLDAILIDPIPTTGIGQAINDRLRRATCQST